MTGGALSKLQILSRYGRICLIALLAANTLFLAIRIVDGLIPSTTVAHALQTGFERGALTTDPYPRDALQGRDRYSDCITAQIAAVGGHGLWRNALTPGLLSTEQVGNDLRIEARNPCLELERFLGGNLRPAAGVNYARFWHGASSVLKGALMILPVDGYRALLLDATLGLIAAVAICAALAERRLLVGLAPLLLLSFAADGQVGYAQLVSYGPSALAAWTVALVMIVKRDRLTDSGLIALAAVAGALEAFFDQMISVPLTASIFLIVAASVLPRTPSGHTSTIARVAGIALAWWIGLAGTYAIKLGLSVLLIGRGALDDFMHQLLFRAGTVDATFGFDAAARASRLTVVTRAILRLIINLWQIAYADGPGVLCLVLVAVGSAGWIAAIVGGIRLARADSHAVFCGPGIGYVAASAIVLLWILIFPEHALRHAFTVRAVAIWLVGGWGFVCSTRRSYSEHLCKDRQLDVGRAFQRHGADHAQLG